MISLTKKFRFETAHRLIHYTGKCNNIHGHSWNGSCTLSFKSESSIDSAVMNNPSQMVIDYADLGKFTKSVENFFDHKLLLCKKDNLFKEGLPGLVLLDKNPTSEYITEIIMKNLIYQSTNTHIKGILKTPKSKVLSYTVRIEETCTTSCEITLPFDPDFCDYDVPIIEMI